MHGEHRGRNRPHRPLPHPPQAPLGNAPYDPDAFTIKLATLARDFTSSARALGADTEAILTAVRDALGPDRA